MNKRYRLELVGITFNQIESGVYALILQQVGAKRRIPIIIGFPEAQAIQCKLQEVATPRPLTHDTMVAALEAFGISLQEVEIRKLPNGVFAADLHFFNGTDEIVIDARSSDAVALAIRVGAPIYTSESVLMEAGFDPENSQAQDEENEIDETEVKVSKESDLSKLTIKQLSEAMIRAAEKEDYEEAAKIKKEIDRRSKNSDTQ
ncbi:MAG: bifunctional nuclease family protein [Muribaculaceae bacterium]|nr:bifunctional nuclease family protein [Muribaculaceae bacterium]